MRWGVRAAAIVLLTLGLQSPGHRARAASAGAFEFVETDEGVELRDEGRVVFFFQRATRSLQGKYARNDYVHPLMSLDGDVLTEDFPEDHLHHRGIFWAWHQLLVGGERVGDGWELQDFETSVGRVTPSIAPDHALLDVSVLWRSPRYRGGEPFLEERTTIAAYRSAHEARPIDFEIALRALAPDVRIGGSEDEKGYGGFSLRLRMPEGLVFTAEGGKVTPRELQIEAGPWMDLSAPYGAGGQVSGVTILTHPSSPGFPQAWILRQTASMQNAVFPGRDPVTVPMDEPLVLRYRLVVHRGAAQPGLLRRWFHEYAEESPPPAPGPE